jgi:hypothetical protein
MILSVTALVIGPLWTYPLLATLDQHRIVGNFVRQRVLVPT